MVDFDYVPSDWDKPDWESCDRVHEWKNYVSPKLRELWKTFTNEQKQAIAESAQGAASNEQWD